MNRGCRLQVQAEIFEVEGWKWRDVALVAYDGSDGRSVVDWGVGRIDDG